jgi:hypothetical protein
MLFLFISFAMTNLRHAAECVSSSRTSRFLPCVEFICTPDIITIAVSHHSESVLYALLLECCILIALEVPSIHHPPHYLELSVACRLASLQKLITEDDNEKCAELNNFRSFSMMHPYKTSFIIFILFRSVRRRFFFAKFYVKNL